MKKSLLALAVLGAFAGAASAQTSVTIYGSFDAGVRYLDNVNANGNSRVTMGSNGTYNSNRLGFKGQEDLGGGMNAHFTLESGFNSGTGALDVANTLFNRTASVGLGGAWGSLDFGRQYGVAFKTIGGYDPMGYKYTGISYAVPSAAVVRYNNDIQYTGTFNGLTVRAEYALGEAVGDIETNSAKAIGVSYANGPFSVGGAYTLRDVAGFDNKHYTVGGAYKFGIGRVSAGFSDARQDTTTVDTTHKYAFVGATVFVAPQASITAAYYHHKNSTSNVDSKRDLIMVGAAYSLSKRTNLYAEADTARLTNLLRASGTHTRQTGFSVGVNHLF